MPTSQITTKGQTTIPKPIREHLHLQPGDQVDFVIHEDGQVTLEPTTCDIAELEGFLQYTGNKIVSVEDMNESIKKRFRKK